MSMRAPGDVSPGHIMLAPLRTNLIAPLSTCSWGSNLGSELKEEHTSGKKSNTNSTYLYTHAHTFM